MAEDLQAARAHWESLGLSVADFDRAAGITAPAPSPAPAQPPQGATQPPAGSTTDLGAFMPAHIAQGAREMVLKGTPEAQVRQALTDQSYSKEAVDRALAGATPEPNEDIRALNAGGIGGEGFTAADYQPQYDRDAIAGLKPDAYFALDGAVREALADWQMTPRIGNDLGKLLLSAAATAQRMSGPERELRERQDAARLVQALGPSEAVEAQQLVEEAIGRLKNQQFASELIISGALNDPMIVSTLAHAIKHNQLRAAIRSGATTLAAVSAAFSGV